MYRPLDVAASAFSAATAGLEFSRPRLTAGVHAQALDDAVQATLTPPGLCEQARAWLAHTEHAGLDIMADAVLTALGTSLQLGLLGVLMLAESPEAARALMTVKAATKTRKVCRSSAAPASCST